jgi:hypothetical protein
MRMASEIGVNRPNIDLQIEASKCQIREAGCCSNIGRARSPGGTGRKSS